MPMFMLAATRLSVPPDGVAFGEIAAGEAAAKPCARGETRRGGFLPHHQTTAPPYYLTKLEYPQFLAPETRRMPDSIGRDAFSEVK